MMMQHKNDMELKNVEVQGMSEKKNLLKIVKIKEVRWKQLNKVK